MKEEEAKTKWCPMVRQSLANYPTFNRGDAENTLNNDSKCPCNCVASLCMMWRTKSEFLTDGYCGLGGKE